MRCQDSQETGAATGRDEYISQAGLHWESDEAVVAMNRVMIEEQRASTARMLSQKEGEPIG
jgi:hypothetical protein